MTTTKAVRSTITLGNIKLDVFQKSDGSYFFSSSQVAAALGINEQSFRPKYISKELKSYLEPLTGLDCLGEKLAIEGNIVLVNVLPLNLVSYIFVFYLAKGNSIAFALTTACVAEALEIRADAAFNVHHTLEERNDKFRIFARLSGIDIRNIWILAIDNYARLHELTQESKHSIQCFVSNAVNVAVLGQTAKEYRLANNLTDKAKIRDTLTSEQLEKIAAIESAATTLVQRDDMNPKLAIIEAIKSLA